jgi:hypothetical protein
MTETARRIARLWRFLQKIKMRCSIKSGGK